MKHVAKHFSKYMDQSRFLSFLVVQNVLVTLPANFCIVLNEGESGEDRWQEQMNKDTLHTRHDTPVKLKSKWSITNMCICHNIFLSSSRLQN